MLQMQGITKKFGTLTAVNRVDLQVERGEIHALLGENGAGKTTLMKVLYGMYIPDEGSIFLDGKRLTIRSPRDAIETGIGMVHQHFMLVPTLTVCENMVLASERSPWRLNLPAMRRRLRELSSRYHLDVDPDAKVGDLSVGEQQRVEILKCLQQDAKVLVLDEATAVLTPQESDGLFEMLRNFTSQGRTVIVITHKLPEVMAVAHRITVMRQGCVVGTVRREEATLEALAEMMVGRGFPEKTERRPAAKVGKPVLNLQNVRLWEGPQGVSQGIDLEVRSGEIVGIAGVDGNGQNELAEVIVGTRRPLKGLVKICEAEVTGAPPARRFSSSGGLGFIPADRHREGLVLGMSISENLSLVGYKKYARAAGLLRWGAIHREAQKLIREYDIRTQSHLQLCVRLSGGNQQKVVLARELSRRPDLIVAVHPTRGLDIGATEYVRDRIVRCRDEGAGVLLISADLDEVMSLSDRIAVMYRGRIVATVDADEATRERVGLLMGGIEAETGS